MMLAGTLHASSRAAAPCCNTSAGSSSSSIPRPTVRVQAHAHRGFEVEVEGAAAPCCSTSTPSTSSEVHRRGPRGSSSSSSSKASRRQALFSGCAVGIGALLLGDGRPAEAGPFLESTGGRGVLAEGEERLYRLRQEREGEARKALNEERARLEKESRETMEGKLCATPFGVDVVGVTELIALAGAVVGGVSARQRKDELERLNEQLRKINLSLRQQARAGTVYAPGLTYAPPVGATAMPGLDMGQSSSTMASTATATLPPPTPVILPKMPPATAEERVMSPATPGQMNFSQVSMEEDEMNAEQLQCRDALRAGKRLLKENGAAAMIRFEKALMLSKQLGDKVQERRAMRGLAASARIQGQFKSAIKHLERVLEISQEFREFTGDADAFGTIADCYTDMGDFDKAAAFYDKYIEAMNRDGPV